MSASNPQSPPRPAVPNEVQTLRRLEDIALMQRIALLGPERIFDFVFDDRDVRMFLPNATHDVIQRIVLTHGIFYESGDLRKSLEYIRPGAVVADIGANIGNHTLFFTLIAGAAEVHAFEPMRTTYRTLRRNIEINGLTQVQAHNVALGAREASANIAAFKLSNIGATTIAVAQDGAYPVRTLDSYALGRLDFVKIDVEGHAVEVLDGARETLARCRPVIWVELWPQRDEVGPGDSMLRSLGYRLLSSMNLANHLYVPE
jgi:FkbM family methyltransferase